MNPGEARYGPSAPSARQRGWYETFTRRGWPGRLVVMRIDSASNVSVTSTPAGSGRSGGGAQGSVATTSKRGSSVKTRTARLGGLRENQRNAWSRQPSRGERTGAKASGST